MTLPISEHTKGLIESGNLSNATLDRAVGNILRKKFAAGLFDQPPTDPAGVANIDSTQHRELARESARQGLVLLMNARPRGDQRTGVENEDEGGEDAERSAPKPAPLPADMSIVKNVAVVGQLGGCGAANGSDCIAKVSMLGGYTAGRISGAGVQVVSIEEAFRERGYNTTWELGTAATGTQSAEDAAAGIAAAADLAAGSDLVVVAVGCVACTCCNRCGCGEAGDRQSFDLEGQQLALLTAVLNASSHVNTQVAVVSICGRPVTFGPGNTVLDKVPALISAFRPGEEGGNAIVDLITGAYSPGGKLAMNWLRSVGQIYSPANPWYQYKWGNWFENGDRTPISPLFEIGHGLSFTSFNVSSLEAPASVAIGASPSANDAAHATFQVSVNVSNTGQREGATTIFATYYKQTNGVVRWARMLCGFTKIHIAAGASTRAIVDIEVSDLARWDPEMMGTDLFGQQVRGAYVVDGGVHDMQVAQCIDSGVSYGVPTRTCSPLQATVTVGQPGQVYIVL